MVFAQLSVSASLRHLTTRINSQKMAHFHLGLQTIKRSTLADANRHRDPAVFEYILSHLMQATRRRVRQECRDLLYLLDSTPIPLKGRGHDWAEGHRSARTTGLKLHLLHAAEADVPVYGHITHPNVNDIDDAREMSLEAGVTYIFDKGYCDYNWWHRIEQAGAHFVTRFKANAALTVQEGRAIPEADREQILEDSLVCFKYRHPGGGRRNHYEKALRRIVVHRPDKDRPLILATNDLTRARPVRLPPVTSGAGASSCTSSG